MFISDSNQKQIREHLKGMQKNVVIQFFYSNLNCETCPDIQQLLKELAELSDKLSLEIINLYADNTVAKSLGIDKVPVISLTDDSGKDYGVRFYGAPTGYEFATLLEDILMISRGDSGLSDETREKLARLEQPVDLKVFVTPTCPYCPAAVRLAHQMAYESPMVTGNMIEATEFPDWATEFDVYGVPKTIINNSESQFFEGAAPEHMVVDKLMDTVA